MRKLVSYTSEELDQMSSETDWERIQAMTDEEIEAADTSDEGLADDWIERAIVIRINGQEVAPEQKTT